MRGGQCRAQQLRFELMRQLIPDIVMALHQ